MQDLLNTNQNLILERSMTEVIDDFLFSFNSEKTKIRYKTVLKQFFDELQINRLEDL